MTSRPKTKSRSQWPLFVALFLFLYLFRTLFGLSLNFFSDLEVGKDSLQIYLIGLKSYTTGTWPYYGPDQYQLHTGFHSQMPGALQGLAVSIPIYLLPIPEAPFLFLNLLSLSALALLSWYIVQRLPKLPFLFVFAWISLLPWTLNQATHIYNPCYLLFGSTLFFVGFFEALPGFALGKLRVWAAYALMGFGTFWDMQFHNSWVLLPPWVLAVFLWRRTRKDGGWAHEVLGFLGGAALPLACLLPTILNAGLTHGSEGLRATLTWFYPENFMNGFTILARYFSFPCFEMPRFIGGGTSERMAYLKAAPWLYVPYFCLLILGWIQPFALLLYGWWKKPAFLKDPKKKDHKQVQLLFFASFLWIWSIFWFTTTGPASHMYLEFLPLSVIYYFYVWNHMTGHRPPWRRFAAIVLVLNLWFQVGFVVNQLMHGRSVYSDRAVIERAIRGKDYRILGERRPWSYY